MVEDKEGSGKKRVSIVEKFMTMEYGPAPEDPREALAWLDLHERRFGHFINGDWQAPAAGTSFDTADPSTGEKLATVAQGSAEDIDRAVKAARAALLAWQALSPHARAHYLYALARQVQKHSRWLAVLGVSAYRAAFGRPEAVAGPQPFSLGCSGVWLLPNPSGLNAHYQLPDLVAAYRRLRQAACII